MSLPGMGLLLLGIALIILGTMRARVPYQRYMALREQDANVARYEAWRGGPRLDPKTSASIAMQMFRRQAQVGGLIVIAGVGCVVLAFVLGSSGA